MTHEAVIQFAPETSVARLNDPRRAGRALYDTSQLRMLCCSGEKTIPLVVDHQMSREIGRVTQLMRLQDVDGWWLCAVAELEKPPSWLKRGTRASFQYRQLMHDSFGNNICRSGLVSEVSVLTDGVKPYEPLAQVLYVKPKVEPKPPPPPAAVTRRSPPAARRITPQSEIDELHRRLEWLGPRADFETVLTNLQVELGGPEGIDSVYRKMKMMGKVR